MKIINKTMVFFISLFSLSSFAAITEYQSLFLDENGVPYKMEDVGDIPRFSEDGRYITYAEKNRSSEPAMARFHRFDTVTQQTQSSDFFISNQDWRASIPYPVTSNGDVIRFYYAGNDENLISYNQYTYNFETNTFTKLDQSRVIYKVSKNGRYVLSSGAVLDSLNGTVYELPEFIDVADQISNLGDIIAETETETETEIIKYNVVTGDSYSLSQLLSNNDGLAFVAAWDVLASISDNGRYIASSSASGAKNLLIDTKDNIVYKGHNFDAAGAITFGNNNTGSSVVMYVNSGYLTGRAGIYDVIGNKTIAETLCEGMSGCENKLIPRVINNNNTSVVGSGSYEENEVSYVSWYIASVIPSASEVTPVGIKVIPQSATIDPYQNVASQFSIDVSGSDIFGLDVSCNLSSASLSITQATYGALFGAQNTMTLPLVAEPAFVSGTETLIAPELPLSGAGSFILADVIAEFTTEDVQVTCAAEVSDENGQLLQVTLTPATIRVDDGVHGGTGAVSGTISIPGVTDLSGIEVVLTIDGRQVTVITDEAGTFSFDGLRDGDFTISLASESYVQSCQDANVAEGNAVNLGAIELLAGDINGDGSIDIADFTFMAARYRSSQGDADYDAKADLNKDGVINIQDLAILGSHFGSTQCNPMVVPQ